METRKWTGKTGKDRGWKRNGGVVTLVAVTYGIVVAYETYKWRFPHPTKEVESHPQYIKIAKWRGRMGNHLFQYMSALGIAQKKNMTYCGAAPFLLERYFHLPVPSLPCPATTFQTVQEYGYATFQLPARLAGNVSLEGFRQSWKYFGSAGVPRIKQNYIDLAEQRIRKMGLRPQEFNAVHIRHGDKAKQWWFRFPPCSYFLSAKRLLGERIPLVVIAEPEAQSFALQFFQSCRLGGKVLLPDHVMVDFATLALANGIVSTMASTFSWWAAYVSGAHLVYYPDEIVKYHRVNLWRFKGDDYYLPQWSKLTGLELRPGLEVLKRRAGFYNPQALTKGLECSTEGNATLAQQVARAATLDPSSCATFVTAYARFSSKHSQDQYAAWLSNLALLDANLVVFGSMEILRWFYHLRPLSLDNKTAYYLTSQEGLYMHRWHTAWSTWQHQMDNEQEIHNWKLYEVWNEKVIFLEHAIRFNVFHCSHFFWIDAGYFRNQETLRIANDVKPFPPPSFLQAHPKVSMLAVRSVGQEIVQAVQEEYPSSVFFERRMDFIAAGLFGGHQEYVLQWNSLFLCAMLRSLERGHFAGKEQNTMANLAIRHEDIVELWDGKAGSCHERWFCMVDVLAGRSSAHEPVPR
eukprot:scaffold840_cov344-Pavlova_lutheri.AAC.126